MVVVGAPEAGALVVSVVVRDTCPQDKASLRSHLHGTSRLGRMLRRRSHQTKTEMYPLRT